MAKSKKMGKIKGPDFGKNNYIFLGIGLFLIIVGFIFLGAGDITVSPILLVLGYCVAIPIGILLPTKKEDSGHSPAQPGGQG